MIQHQGIWLPEGEKHLVAWMSTGGEIVDGKGTYQINKLRAALRYVPNAAATTAIDVGAHVGLWSMHLAPRFSWLFAFEPVAEFRECFARNVGERNVTLHPLALGDKAGEVAMRRHGESSGDTVVVPGTGTRMSTLDEAMGSGPLEGVGLIKMDCEGYEEHVVRGGKATIQHYRPVVIVEQKPRVLLKNFGSREPRAIRLLESWGYRIREEISGDYILTIA